jgi:hypothetical protein
MARISAAMLCLTLAAVPLLPVPARAELSAKATVSDFLAACGQDTSSNSDCAGLVSQVEIYAGYADDKICIPEDATDDTEQVATWVHANEPAGANAPNAIDDALEALYPCAAH